MNLLKNIWEDYQTQKELSNEGISIRTGIKAKKGKSSTFQTVSMIYRQSLANLINVFNF
jgi:myosin heavy chain 6/7